MKRAAVIFSAVVLVITFQMVLLSTGCKKEAPPTAATALNQPTPLPPAISGPLEVYVTDNYIVYPTPASTPSLNSLPVTGLTVLAIPPSNSVTYTKVTQPDGKAYFTPPTLEVGNWTIVVPQQTGYPFAKSVVTAPVSVAYETIPVYSSPGTLYNSSNTPQVLTSSLGGTVVANFTYNQPGGLLVPVNFGFPSLPTNWTAHSGVASIGFASSDQASVTFIATPCVDKAVSYTISGYDFQPTPVLRVVSAPASITKSYTSTASVSYQQNNYVGNCCSGDGYIILTMTGTLTFSSSNACGNITVWWDSGDCNTQGMQIGGSSQSAQDCGGGSFSLPPGSYSLTVNNTRYQPHMYVSFQGTTYGPYYFQLNSNDYHQFFSVSY